MKQTHESREQSGGKQNPVKLCHDIARLFHGRIREQRICEGVMSQPGARMIMPLLAHQGSLSQRQLAEQTHLKAPSVSAILRKMEQEGLVSRRQDPEDHRKVWVTLTDEGRMLDDQIRTTLCATDAMALEGLTPAEIETLMELLGRIRSNLLPEKGERV